MRNQNADATAARRMPDPVADSQTKSNLASSGVGFGTTGAVRMTARCNPGTSQCGVSVFSERLIGGNPQSNTNTVRNTHGIHADQYERGTISSAAGSSICVSGSSGKRQVS